MRKGSPKGKQWRLPTGPAGVHLVGHLPQMRKGCRDEVGMSDDVGCILAAGTQPLLRSRWLFSLAQHGEMTALRVGSKALGSAEQPPRRLRLSSPREEITPTSDRTCLLLADSWLVGNHFVL